MATTVSPSGIFDGGLGNPTLVPGPVTVSLAGIIPGVVSNPLFQIAVNMNGNDKVTLFADPMNGNTSAQVIGVPVWSTSDASLVRLSPSADGLSCVVFALGQSGTCQVIWKAQGAGTVVGQVTINITSVLANNVVMILGRPTRAC